MQKQIQIKVGEYTIRAVLFDTPTARQIYDNLPFEGKCTLWGDEIYFTIPPQLPLEPEAHEIVEPGELGYWPVGNAFCIFFGPTPASSGPEPRAYSSVNVFGKITGDLSILKRIKSATPIEVTKID